MVVEDGHDVDLIGSVCRGEDLMSSISRSDGQSDGLKEESCAFQEARRWGYKFLPSGVNGCVQCFGLSRDWPRVTAARLFLAGLCRSELNDAGVAHSVI